MNMFNFVIPLNKQNITPNITSKDAAFVQCNN